jgi:hypothetical protein
MLIAVSAGSCTKAEKTTIVSPAVELTVTADEADPAITAGWTYAPIPSEGSAGYEKNTIVLEPTGYLVEAVLLDETGAITEETAPAGTLIYDSPFEVAVRKIELKDLEYGATYRITVTAFSDVEIPPDGKEAGGQTAAGTQRYVSDSPVAATIKMPNAKPKAPVVTAAAAGYSEIELKWNAVKGAEEYMIFRSDAVDGEYTKIGQTGNGAPAYIDRGLEELTEYFYQVTSATKDYISEPSEIVSVTTDEDPAKAEERAQAAAAATQKKNTGGSSIAGQPGSNGNGSAGGNGTSAPPSNYGQYLGEAWFCKCGARFGSSGEASSHMMGMQDAWAMEHHGDGTQDPLHSNYGNIGLYKGVNDMWSNSQLYQDLASHVGW